MKIWTIGHSTHDLDVFLSMLKSHNIEMLVDVRSLPGSRRYPHFNAENLAPAVRETGIGYMHFKMLGGKRRQRKDSQNTVWKNLSFRAYADYMETPEFESGIWQLLVVAATHRVAFMCSEAVWWRCHRSMISDYLKAHGHTVIHIMGSQDQEHPFTSAARMVDGQLTYKAEAA